MKKRSGVLLFLVSLSMITFLDRIAIAVAGPRMQEELNISPSRWGWILGAFVLSYGLFEIPSGALGDRFGRRSQLARIVMWWSVFTSLTGAARGFWPLAAARFLFGVGEAGAYPNAAGVIARWFPTRERARAQGFVWAAGRFGGALTPLVVVPLMAAVGWRAVFWIFGGVGMLWAVAWYAWFRDRPAEQPGITAEEVEAIGDNAPPAHGPIAWRRLFASRQMRLLVVMYGSQAWGSWFYFNWFPTYLRKGVGFAESDMAIFASLPFLCGAIGNITGGFLSDWLTTRYGLRIGRCGLGAVSLAAGGFLILAMALVRDRTAIVVLASLGFGVMDIMLPAAWAICVELGRANAGVVSGVMNTSGQLGGFLCTVLFGYVTEATGRYDIPVWFVAAMVVFSATIFARIDPSQPIVAVEPPATLR